MKTKRTFIVYVLIVMLCLVMFAGCTPDKDEPDAQSSTPPSNTQYEGAQPGAKTREQINPDGSKEYHYQNPDGTGGGGVELD